MVGIKCITVNKLLTDSCKIKFRNPQFWIKCNSISVFFWNIRSPQLLTKISNVLLLSKIVPQKPAFIIFNYQFNIAIRIYLYVAVAFTSENSFTQAYIIENDSAINFEIAFCFFKIIYTFGILGSILGLVSFPLILLLGCTRHH